jgi:GntR family transcriptional regulator/MocR family aminotransferase
MSRRDFVVPPIVLDTGSHVPLSGQIRQQIASAIRSGAIRRGARLPSTRWMARLLRVSRNTVFTAYGELVADDLIRGERGAGMRVVAAAPCSGTAGFGLRQVVREAHYPARVFPLMDPDGNPLYFNFLIR